MMDECGTFGPSASVLGKRREQLGLAEACLTADTLRSAWERCRSVSCAEVSTLWTSDPDYGSRTP